MDAPTWRGAYDRFLILPQGRLNIIDFDFYRNIAEKGIPEKDLWRLSWRSKPRFDPIWEMVLEGSTGYSGTFARQLTLNRKTANQRLTLELLPALEASAAEEAIVLQVEALLDGKNMTLQFQRGHYIQVDKNRQSFTREQLIGYAKEGKFLGSFTARHGAQSGFFIPQPALWTLSSIQEQSGRQQFPILAGGNQTMTMNARHVTEDAHVIVDGRRVQATVKKGTAETIAITIDSLPPNGLHFLQIQNSQGLFSNDLFSRRG